MNDKRDTLGTNDRLRQERFMALLSPVLEKLSRYCHALTHDTENGRDLLSDAILLSYESFDSLRAEEAFTSYVFTTARRLYYRSERRKKWWGIFGEETDRIADSNTSPETRVDLQILDSALQELPEKQREAVILFEISGLSLEEIRMIQGGSLSGVKSRVVRGREKLAELLKDPVIEITSKGSTRPMTLPQKLERTAHLVREKI